MFVEGSGNGLVAGTSENATRISYRLGGTIAIDQRPLRVRFRSEGTLHVDPTIPHVNVMHLVTKFIRRGDNQV